MSFFQNPMGEEFRGSWPIDQQANFIIGANLNNIAEMISGTAEPYDFSVNNIFTINIAYDPQKLCYTAIPVNVAGAIPAATTATEVVQALNANPLFADNFSASLVNATKGGAVTYGPPFKILIRCTKTRQAARIYVTNCGAESELLFNYRAFIKQFPTYFEKFTIANRFVYSMPTPAPSLLVELDPTIPCQAQLIVNAGEAYVVGLTNTSAVVTTTNTDPFLVGDSVVAFDGTTTLAATVIAVVPGVSVTLSAPWAGSTESGHLIDILADWELLADRSNTHMFFNITQDGSSRITQIIEYFCGAVAGDMARKIQYVYSGTSLVPIQVTTIPYTLTAADLVTPP